MRTEGEISAANQAVDAMGGANKAAKMLSIDGFTVTREAVGMWRLNGVNYAWITRVALASGVPAGELSIYYVE